LPTPYIGLTLGLVVGLALGVALFRFAIAVSMGAVVGLAGVLISLVVMTPAEARTDARGAVESAAEASLADPAPTAGEDGEAADEPAPRPGSAEEAAARLALSEETRARARAAAERVQAFLAALGEALRPRWEALPARSRLTIVAAGLGGVVAGFLV